MNQDNEKSHVKKETRSLRKKLKRTEKSRNLTKAKNREKSKIIKTHQDREQELKDSRNMWKTKCKEQKKENGKLRDDVKFLANRLEITEEDLQKIVDEFNELKKKSHPGFGTRKHTK